MKKLEHRLYQDESVKRVFTLPTMVFYRITKKLYSYMFRAKLYPLEWRRDSRRRGNLRCLVCSNIEETDTFTGESFKINHHLCWNDKCLIYLSTCKIDKKQHTGKIVDRFRLRCSNYKESDRQFLRGEEI